MNKACSYLAIISIGRRADRQVTRSTRSTRRPTSRCSTCGSASSRWNNKRKPPRPQPPPKWRLLQVGRVLLIAWVTRQRRTGWTTCADCVCCVWALWRDGDQTIRDSLSNRRRAGSRCVCTELYNCWMRYFTKSPSTNQCQVIGNYFDRWQIIGENHSWLSEIIRSC